jgi:large subunit ribosomal protein L15
MNLEKIQSFINEKTINPSDTINIDLLKKLKLINKNSQKLKILGTGDIKDKVSIEADLISKAAVVKLEKAGGTIQLKK